MPTAFRTQADFRRWLEKNYASEKELILRLFKVHAKHRGIGYREALDEALCFGWIDGVVHALDKDSFTQRYTPRRTKSKWSEVNIKRFKQLQRSGAVHPAGKAAFEARVGIAVAPYSYESRAVKLAPAFEKQLRADKRAWEFYQSQAPYQRKVAAFWIMTAKKDETKERRFAELLDRCRRGVRFGVLEPKK